MSDGATVQQGVNPVGVGVVLLGALLALIGSFAPIHQYGAVAVEKNSYVAEGRWWVLVIALIMGAAAATALARGGGPSLVWRLGAPSAVALGAGIWGTTSHFQTLQTFGSLAVLGNTVIATPGPGVYLVLAGGGIGLIGTGMTIGKWGPVGVPLYSRRTKQCPECAERVLEDANVCKHCGYRFESERPPRRAAPQSVTATPARTSRQSTQLDPEEITARGAATEPDSETQGPSEPPQPAIVTAREPAPEIPQGSLPAAKPATATPHGRPTQQLIGAYVGAALVPPLGFVAMTYVALAERTRDVRRHAIGIGAVTLAGTGVYLAIILSVAGGSTVRTPVASHVAPKAAHIPPPDIGAGMTSTASNTPSGPSLPFFKNTNNLPSWLGGGHVPNGYWGICGTTRIEEVTNNGCGQIDLRTPFLRSWKRTGHPPQSVTDPFQNNYNCAHTRYLNVWKCTNPGPGIWVEFLAKAPQ
jgi:hypothetical protein